jgi:hypothetical protein
MSQSDSYTTPKYWAGPHAKVLEPIPSHTSFHDPQKPIFVRSRTR